jgi:hypothetical protein
MEIEIDMDGWQFPAAVGDSDRVRPDWQGLRARMAAASAVWTMLADAAVHPAPQTGSFHRRSATAIDAFWHDLSGVNPSALLDGRDVGGNNGYVTGSSAAGCRGT